MPVAAVAVVGCGLALLWPVLPPAWWRGVLLVAGLLGMLLCRPWYGRLLGLALVFMAWTWLQAGWVLASRWPPAWDGRALTVQGVVVDLPRHQGTASRFVFRIEQVVGERAAAGGSLAGRMLELHWRDRHGQAPDPQRTRVAAGQHWRLGVTVRAPRSLANPGGFDSARHALANRVDGIGWVETGTGVLLEPGRGLHHWRGGMSARIAAALPARHAPFIRALALGDTSALQAWQWQVLRSTGLTHLVAISGFHVTLLGVVSAWLAGALWRALPRLAWRLPRSQAQAWGGLLGAGLYACAAGLGLPAVRTVLMVAVVCLARSCRRTTSVWQCVAWALLAMLAVDPLALLAAGFWLSFAGVAWLAWSLGSTALPPWRGLLAAQWVATLGLLPLTVFLFGQASLVGPVANLLAIPWWSLVVVPLCVLGLLLESLWAGSGLWAWQLAGWAFAPSWPLFEAMSSHALAEWWLPEAGMVATGLALLGCAVVLMPRAMPGRLLGLLLWLPLLWPRIDAPARGGLQVVMLDVGQGLAVLLRTQRHALLYDAGPAVPDGFDAGERVVVPALRALGVRRLDTVVISHGDLDHAGGAPAVMAHFPAEEVHGPTGMEVAVEATHRCERGLRWQWDAVEFEYLHPSAFFPYLGNESSCVLRVTAQDRRLLLTGDVGHIIERQLLAGGRESLHAEVVQVGHHGSAGSSQGAFIRAAGARLALVSAGEGNRFGHPHPGVVARWEGEGAEVLQTAHSGAITVWIDAAGASVRERRQWQRRLWH